MKRFPTKLNAVTSSHHFDWRVVVFLFFHFLHRLCLFFVRVQLFQTNTSMISLNGTQTETKNFLQYQIVFRILTNKLAVGILYKVLFTMCDRIVFFFFSFFLSFDIPFDIFSSCNDRFSIPFSKVILKLRVRKWIRCQMLYHIAIYDIWARE